MSVSEGVRRFHLNEEILILAGYGRERWYYDKTLPDTKKMIDNFRKRAAENEFVLEGIAEFNY